MLSVASNLCLSFHTVIQMFFKSLYRFLRDYYKCAINWDRTAWKARKDWHCPEFIVWESCSWVCAKLINYIIVTYLGEILHILCFSKATFSKIIIKFSLDSLGRMKLLLSMYVKYPISLVFPSILSKNLYFSWYLD